MRCFLWMSLLSLLFGCDNETSYHKKGGKWYYEGAPINREDDWSNFVQMDGYFARDDRTAYYRGTPIAPGDDPSDGASFEVLNTWYAKDRSRVYYCETYRDSKEYWSIKRTRISVVRSADPASFHLLSDGYTARDKVHVYADGEIMSVRDVDSYELLENGFSRDNKRAYYNRVEIEGSDGASFMTLDAHYGMDKSKIYYVEGFYVGGALKDVVAESFKVLGDGYATDGARAYYRGVVISKADAASLSYLQSKGYAKTRSQVFHDGVLMRDADAPSFSLAEEFSSDSDATDRSGSFLSGVRVVSLQPRH